MEYLALHTGAPTVNWEDNTGFIYVVAHRVKHIYIPVYFLQEQFDNFIFVTKYEKSTVIPEDMCTNPFSGPIISHIPNWMTGLIFYPTNDT